MYMAGVGFNGLGLSLSDLPRGGQNLRLYTYDPPGSQYGAGSYAYNTGHFDITLPGGACSQADPQGFNDWQSMASYAGQRGEMLVLVTRDDLPTLCSARAPAAPAPVVSPTTPTSVQPISVQATPVSSQGQSISITGRPLNLTPTGINVPVSVYSPGGGPPTIVQSGTAPATDSGSSILPIIAAGAAVLSLLG